MYVTQRKGANKKKFPDLEKFPPSTPTSKPEKHTPNMLFLQKKFPFAYFPYPGLKQIWKLP